MQRSENVCRCTAEGIDVIQSPDVAVPLLLPLYMEALKSRVASFRRSFRRTEDLLQVLKRLLSSGGLDTWRSRAGTNPH